MSTTTIRGANNGTGTSQIKAGTISNTDIHTSAAIASTKLAAWSASRDANSQKLINLLDPTNPQDGATKNYVDNAVQGLSVKGAALAASTANLTLSGTQTVDGIALSVNDRILVKDQTTPKDNGLYTVQSGAWVRTLDMDVWTEVPSAFVFVEEGTANADTGWVCSSDPGGTLGTTAITWVQFSSAGIVTAGNGLQKVGNVISVLLPASSGLSATGSGLSVVLNGATLNLGSSGLKITAGTPGQVMIGTTTTGEALFTTLSGDVSSINGGGTVTLGSTIQRTANIITRETPTGTIDGANTTFTLANTPIATSEEVFLNGVLQEPGAGNDYTISGGTITYLTAPISGDRVRVNYRK